MKIALSSYSGAGVTTTTNLLAQKLNLTPVNYTLRNLASDLKLSFEEIKLKAEQTPYYDYLLDSKLIHQAQQDNWIMGSRLAIWFDTNPAKRIWLECPLEERSRRIAKRENLPYEKALEQTSQRDELNKQRYLKLYGINVSEHNFVDAIISTEQPPEQVVKQILEANPRNLNNKTSNINDIINQKINELKL